MNQVARPGALYVGAALLLLCGAPVQAQSTPTQPAAAGVAVGGASDTPIDFRLPPLEAVAFRGVFNLDGVAAPSHAMLYPAFGLAGFVGSLLAHGLLVEGSKQSQRTQAEKDADRVLESLQPVLSGFSNSSLIAAALEQSSLKSRGRLLGLEQASSSGWVVESAPIIWVTQDRLSLIADISFAIRMPSAGPAWQGRVRVVSDRISADDPVAHWSADAGAPLKLATAKLLARAFEIGVKYAQQADQQAVAELPFQTVRYSLGGRKKVERAQVLQQDCDYRLLKTLRGDFYAVPTSKLTLDDDEAAADCQQPNSPAAGPSKSADAKPA
jgi:hypothetical protein